MPDEEMLFSLLEFVALVAPAIAILIQVVQSSDGDNAGLVRGMELGLLLVFTGGLVVMFQLLQIINDPVTFLGTALIFGSLMFAALAIAWTSLPVIEDITLSVESTGDLWFLFKSFFRVAISFSLPFGLYYLFFLVTSTYALLILNIGPVYSPDQDLATDLFLIILGSVALRIVFYLVNTGYLVRYSFKETFSESLKMTIFLPLILSVFVVPVYATFHIPLIPQVDIINISSDRMIFVLPHIWLLLMIFVLFITDFEEEKEDTESEE